MREKEAGNRWSNFELFCWHVLICCSKKTQQRHQNEGTKIWSRTGAENPSRSTFWLLCQKQNFWLMQPLSRAPNEIFGKYIKDMPMYLNLPNCFPFLKSVSLDLEFCLQTSKPPQIWKGNFLLRNTHQPVPYYWLDGSLHWQWHKTRTPASPACKDHEEPTLLSFICVWRANFQDSFPQNLFKMSACWQR